jgi:prepilin-type N-terminal cleavage/methylation domain-containing protein
MFRSVSNQKACTSGFTLIEVVVGSALFLVVAMAAYGAYTSLFQVAQLNQTKFLAIALADEQLEIIRNMPYVNVGLTTGIPQGTLLRTQTLVRGNVYFTVTLTIRNINLSTSTYQASSKLVEVEVSCPTCKNFQPVTLTGQVSPANLQSAGSGGALVVQVLDSNGNPVEGATVFMQSTATTSIQNTDVTNSSGLLNIIGVPEGINVYHVQATKSGYSSDETSPITEQNPTPAKPDATVLNQQASQITLTIDELSSLHFTSVSPTCSPVGGFDFNLKGARQNGVGQSLYDQNKVTDGGGTLDIDPIGWDTYAVTPIDASYDIAGITPTSPFILNAGNSQNVQLVVESKQSNALMVSVLDDATKLPLSNATVHVSGPGGIDQTQITGQGYMRQVDWSAGSGQENFTNPSAYFSDDGNIDTSVAGNVTLKEAFGEYNPNGSFISSIFDVGSPSNFYSLSWSPTNQPVQAGLDSLKFQLASNEEVTATSTWDFIGPDGTENTFYTITDSPIASDHSGDRYIRYKAFLHTDNATSTPTLSNVSFTYTSSCTPPGQVLFGGLSAGTYNISVSRNGYTSWSGTVSVSGSWQNEVVELGI